MDNHYIQLAEMDQTMAFKKIGLRGLIFLQLWRRVLLFIVVIIGHWGFNSAMAAQKPEMILSVNGAQRVKVNEFFDNVIVRLANPKAINAPNSQLRLFIHDKEERELQHTDVEVEVLERNAWTKVQFELLESSLMGAIGREKNPVQLKKNTKRVANKKRPSHRNPHQPGGFTIRNVVNKVWRLRIKFLSPGQYSFVMSVSPDNGQTHLVQPISWEVEAL